MNLQQLEYFKKIAETENFTTAATLISVSQPALSKAISKLEDELKVPLFQRNKRNVTLTSYGKSFLIHTDLALLQIEKGIEELKFMVNSEEGNISIASTHCIGTYFMPFIISGFLSISPDTKFQFNHQPTSKIIKDLKEGKISLGFYEKNDNLLTNTEIESIPVKKEKYVLIVAKNHFLAKETEVSLKDLKNESFIVYCDENKDKMLSYSEFIDYTPKVSIQPSEASMLGGLVAAGVGITIVPNTPLINTNTLSIVNIKEDIGYKTIYMGWLKNSSLSLNTTKFKDYVLSLI
ncbi:LysR family transcriptional regulator [Clostridium grantii]|uniref:Transcriptional regulator, LysR family n=1 Tax=Clostridium grantii DSM 8605 TaxID=1121316 RepID=A0A1M5W151_9CLOT|nr:LysR family transcriptional regulator [Clostridium grantii]SHH81246.1 transcriptional regulator, LysR family [Clostridium grantii DSM 8605]